VTSARGGFELIDLLDRLRPAPPIVDALRHAEPSPGRVHRLAPHEVAGSAPPVGGHDLGLARALELARDARHPRCPASVTVFAIEAGDVTTFSETMSPAVTAAIGGLAREIHEALARGDAI